MKTEFVYGRGVSPETAQKVDLETLDKLCELFNCQLGDLLERVPGSTPYARQRHSISEMEFLNHDIL
ncbi:helix-turn-helix transcriptional regulator [Serratia marcescens]|nr:helix-turn-helix transcriptional regulator [Serratia marcescens]